MTQKTYRYSREELVPIKSFDGTKIFRHLRDHPSQVALFAMTLLERHAGITASVDGEDSSGRSKVRRDLPKEIVAYCCDVAENAFAEFTKRGWLMEIPDWDTVYEDANQSN